MPKLDSNTAQRVQSGADNAGDGNFEVLPEGLYLLRMRGVEVKEVGNNGKEPKLYGAPMWTWEFEIPEGQEHAGRRFWTNRILPMDNGYQHADFMLSKFVDPFTALGGTIDTDTDELVGKICKGYIVERVIEKGARAGERSNSLEDLVPAGDESTTTKAEDESYDF
jgi:hypothetical protein